MKIRQKSRAVPCRKLILIRSWAIPMSHSKFNATLNKDDVRSDLLYEAYTDLREGDADVPFEALFCIYPQG